MIRPLILTATLIGGLAMAETPALLSAETEASSDVHVTTDDTSSESFGAFVKTQVAAGLRGTELAASIHAEQAARGKGKPAHAGGPKQRPGR